MNAAMGHALVRDPDKRHYDLPYQTQLKPTR
jgi:hypothetical protein